MSRSDLYTAAALAGAAVVVVGRLLDFPTLRFLAVRRELRLPVAGWPEAANEDERGPRP